MSNAHKETFFKAAATLASFGMCFYLGNGEKSGDVLNTIGMAVGGNWLSEYTGQYVKSIKEKWLNNEKPVINHHIQKSLGSAFQRALHDVRKSYRSTNANNREGRATLKIVDDFIEFLVEVSNAEFMEGVNEQFDKDELFQYLSIDSEAVKPVLEQRLKVNAALIFFTKQYGLSQKFQDHLAETLPERFSFYFREELKKGTEAKHAMDLLYSETIRLHVALIPNLVTKFDHQGEILRLIQQQLEFNPAKDSIFEIQKQALLNIAGALEDFKVRIKSQPRLTYDFRNVGRKSSMVFRSRSSTFIGRGNELRLLKRFFYGDNKFDWCLVTGSAGSGKSRLAMELCFDLVKELDLYCGFIDSQVTARFQWADWKPAKPTLIIIDYAANSWQQVMQLIKDLATPWEEFAFPVRLLLLEREAKGKWWTEFSYEVAQMRMPQCFNDEPFVLPSLADETNWRIFSEILVTQETTLPDKEDTIAALIKIDERRRPIFSILAALAFVNDKHAIERDRYQLMDDYLNREEHEIWQPAVHNDEPELSRYKNLITYTTLCGGIDVDHLTSLVGEGYSWLPASDYSIREIESRHSRMCAQVQVHQLAALEPDIIGEYFVLKHLHSIPARERDILVNLAWDKDPVAFFSFNVRCYQDFRDNKLILPFPDHADLENDEIKHICFQYLQLFSFIHSNPYLRIKVQQSSPWISKLHHSILDTITGIQKTVQRKNHRHRMEKQGGWGF